MSCALMTQISEVALYVSEGGPKGHRDGQLSENLPQATLESHSGKKKKKRNRDVSLEERNT